MSLSATLPQPILDTVLAHLALLFLAAAGGDQAAARDAASQMLAAYAPETPEELSLAAEIISFSFHALEALGQAADPALPLTRTIRLRGSAVSLSREAHKSQRKLDRLQKSRRTAPQPKPNRITSQPQDPQPEPIPLTSTNDIPLVIGQAQPVTQQPVMATSAGKVPWSQTLRERMTAKRKAEKARKAAAKQARQTRHGNPPVANVVQSAA